MVSERELVGLLHRVDWTTLTLSGTVTGAERVVDIVITVQSDEPPSGPWEREDAGPPPPPEFLSRLQGQVPPWFFERVAEERVAEDSRGAGHGQASSWTFAPRGEGAPCVLSVSPGRRFRAEFTDGAWVLGCDGERMWHWLRDRPAGVFGRFDGRPQPPYRSLLEPSWLLTGYSLVLDGEVTVCGRPGVRVLATPRTVAEPANRFGRLGGQAGGGPFAAPARWLRLGHQDDDVAAVVDAELGILLRCSKRSGDRMPAVTEFTSLDVGLAAEASLFTAPPGSVFGGGDSRARGRGERPPGGAAGGSLGDALGEALGTAGKEAAKTVAGMAAGGLGALIRYAPKGRSDPFAQATAEAVDPEAAMPADERPPEEPAGGAQDEALPDEVLHLLYRSGLAAPSLRATLHQWADLDPVFAAVPRSARGTGFGGVGFLVDAVRDLTREEGTGSLHAVSTVAMGGWNEYRIDVVRAIWERNTPPGRGRDKDVARAIASDGVRQWQVYGDRVVSGPASRPTGDLADLVDASWLLEGDLDLSGGTEVWAGGRRAYRVVARYRDVAGLGMGWWQRHFYPAVAVVDAETGALLRLTRFKGGRPVLRQELRDFAEPDASPDFSFTPPAGLPVYDAESDPEAAPPRPPKWPFWSWSPCQPPWSRDEPPR